MLLGHGAGGGVTAHDLRLATEVALGRDLAVALVEQPYRVAGEEGASTSCPGGCRLVCRRRAPALGARQPAAGRRRTLLRRPGRLPDVQRRPGRSECCAWPSRYIHPAVRRGPGSRELTAVTVPTLVVQGDSDPFGVRTAKPCPTGSRSPW